MRHAIIADCETTSAGDDAALIEYGEMPCGFEDGTLNFGDVRVQRFNPGKPIEFGAVATHGITDEDVQTWPPVSQFTFEPVEYLIGHSIDFDHRIIGSPDCKRICTLALSRSLWPTLDSHKLLALIYFLDVDAGRQFHKNAHGVSADIQACAYLLIRMLETLKPVDMEDLWKMSEEARIPKVMSFGKMKGQPISAVDQGYRDWYRRQPDPDAYLLKAFDQQPYKP